MNFSVVLSWFGLCSVEDTSFRKFSLRPRPFIFFATGAHKYGVNGDRRGLAGTTQKPPLVLKNTKNTFMISGVPFEVDAKYAPLKLLGEGSYGMVCSFLNMETGERVAIKRIGGALSHPVTALRTLREMQILRHIRHPDVIALKDATLSGHVVYLIYEQMDTDLHRLISDPTTALSDGHCRYFMFQLLRGLKHLHLSGVIHRDLKPENILINSNLDLKICDFGLSRTKCRRSQVMTEYVATRWYGAPEILMGSNSYGSEVDMWSVGCIFAEMLGRRPLFRGSNAHDQLIKIIGVLGRQEDLSFVENERVKKQVASVELLGLDLSLIYPQADHLAIDLLRKMLMFDPRKRMTAMQALSHPYFVSFHGLDLYSSNPGVVSLSVDSEEPDCKDKEKLRTLMLAEIVFVGGVN